MTEENHYRSYENFAVVYDTFMDNIPYDEWCRYLVQLLKENGVIDGIILDLGCGTGNITTRLSDAGYDMIGIDNSEDMLAVAREKSEQEEHKILYLLQDMREIELYGTVSAVVSICDSMNYILEEKELLEIFKLVNNYLEPQGIFIFDLNTKYKYQEILAENTFAENREESSFIWENYYDEEDSINEYILTLFMKKNNHTHNKNENIFLRYEEVHYQKAYEIDTVVQLIEEAGLEFVAVYDAVTHNKPQEDSERVYMIAKEKTKEKILCHSV